MILKFRDPIIELQWEEDTNCKDIRLLNDSQKDDKEWFTELKIYPSSI